MAVEANSAHLEWSERILASARQLVGDGELGLSPIVTSEKSYRIW